MSGDSCEGFAIIKDTGDAATSPLLAFITEGTNLPVTPNGSNITIILNSSSLGIFQV